MNLSQLEFGALLTYAPHGDSQEARNSKDIMHALKKEGFISNTLQNGKMLYI
jgi:hypothetical protein